MIETIQTVHSIIPATHLRKTDISVPPYVFILKDLHSPLLAVWWGLGICHGSCDISNMNLGNGDHSTAEGTHAFVMWLVGGSHHMSIFKNGGGVSSLQ